MFDGPLNKPFDSCPKTCHERPRRLTFCMKSKELMPLENKIIHLITPVPTLKFYVRAIREGLKPVKN